MNSRPPARFLVYLVSLPERLVRAAFAGSGGAIRETSQLLLPRFARRSRLYEVTASNALRIATELIGGVEGSDRFVEAGAPSAGRVAAKKAAGNVVEFGSIAAFGFSPLWLLAGASDVLSGSRVFLRTLEDELANAGVLREGVRFGSVDQLIGAIEGASGQTAGLIDLPPLELSELKASLAELKGNASSLPSAKEMTALLNGLVETARLEQRSLLEVSSGVGFAFLASAKHLGRQHVVEAYREDWQPVRSEGFGAYAARIAAPYRAAMQGHFSPTRETHTERLPSRVRAGTSVGARWVRGRLRR
ncbi:MAG: hypothetical protein R3C39_00570 [Dehalococcoidia bacterium]